MSDFVSAAEKPRLRPVEHLFAVIEAGNRGVFQAPPAFSMKTALPTGTSS